MKKYFIRFNYLVLFIVAGLMAFGSVVPAITPTASAQQLPGGGGNLNRAGTFWKLSVEDQAEVWSAFKAATAECQFGSEGLSADQLTRGQWFYSGSARVGHHLKPDNGVIQCNNENSWFSNILSQAELTGDIIASAKQVFREGRDGKYYPDPNPAAARDKLRALLTPKIFGSTHPPASAPAYVQYGILMGNFTAPDACGASRVTNETERAAYNNHKKIWVYNNDSNTPEQVEFGYNQKDVTAGWGLEHIDGGNDKRFRCETLANALADQQYARAVVDCVGAARCTGSGSGSSTTPADDPQLQCGTMKNPLNWFLCPIIKGINGMVNALDNGVNSLLAVDRDEIFGPCDANDQGCAQSAAGYHKAWQAFRNIALGILVIAALAMVISQGLGFEFLDAYTIKKIFPRLVIAIIGISLSWEIMNWFVGFTNDLGYGIRQLIYYPFEGLRSHSDLELGGGATVAVTLLTSGALLALGIMGLLSFGLTALMAVIVAFLVLIVRQLVIIVLILLAPVAIACYILPNTNGIWKFWYESFTKALLMFPIIVAFLATGRVFALTATATNSGEVTAISQLIGFAAYFLPYFMIPLTFRFAGGLMRTVGGFTNDHSRGAFDRLKKYRQGQFQSHGGVRIQRGQERALQARYRAYKSLQATQGSDTRAGRLKRFAGRSAAGLVGGFNIEEQISANNARNAKRMREQTGDGPDDLVRAYTVNKEYADNLLASGDARADDYVREKKDAFGNVVGKEYRTLGGAWKDESAVIASQRAFGKNNHAAFQAALTYEMGKAGTQEEQDHLVTSYGASAKRFGLTDTEANEVWIGSSYAKQNENRQWKYHKWKSDANGDLQNEVSGIQLMRDIDEKQGNYAMMQQNADTWTTMSQEMITARQIIDGQIAGDRVRAEETLRRGARIAHATASASMAPTVVPGEDGGADTGQRMSGREIGAGAPGRVQQEMAAFVDIANSAAGKEFAHRPHSYEGLNQRDARR